MSSIPDGVAIVGMAGRFPGADSIEAFWRNLCAAQESITHFDAAQLSPLVPAAQRSHPRYVAARGVIADAERFDAAFFGISPRDAQLMDPQQRVFLELCWNALEHAGVDTQRYAGSIGVYAGVSNNGYRKLLEGRPDLLAASGDFAAMLANEKDYVATRVAHRIGLDGPAISLYTACSTSLVAVAQAWYALMSWQCDAALAGGMNIVVPQASGHVAVDGGMESGDGHCRPFDAQASGTLFSSGGGVVVLKRLADALADRDTIWAVIRGVGVNNDGADKASFTAPSARGQAGAVRRALASAGVDAGSIGYVEAHGTGTQLGDPIEVEALTRAFRTDSAANQYCWLGSVKSNIGHLVAGAGVTGLIKAALALHHERIPATLHHAQANPEIDFATTPFKVADRTIEWPRGAAPRRAGVSSFGVGGTNAHVILEEAPLPPAPGVAPRAQIVLPLSARDEAGLQQRAAQLATALEQHADADLADIGWTLARGRRALRTRGAVVARSVEEARARLRNLQAQQAIEQPRIVLLFPGQGSQHAGMARGLVESEPVFAAEFARCCELASPLLGRDLRELILPDAASQDAASQQLAQTRYAQPALFTVEYALAKLWQSWGTGADLMIGHSIGEYVAACIAGVFSLDNAMRLIVARGAAMDAQAHGAMLAVRAAEGELTQRLPRGVDIAAVNAPDSIVVGGSDGDIDEFARQLESAQIASTRLRVSHAFHSALMDSALPIFRRAFEDIELHAPRIPFYSCVSGRPISAQDATSPDYWCRQIRAPVRFADAAGHALEDSRCIALEVGPGQALSGLLRRRGEWRERVVSSLGPAGGPGSDAASIAGAAGKLWCAGAALDWERYFDAAQRRRLPLPGYPFQGPRYWIDDPAMDGAAIETKSEPAVAAADEAPAGADALRTELRALVASLCGAPIGAAQDESHFLDLGLDSLALTQLALELERRHALKVKLRSLSEELGSIAKLAERIETAAAPVAAARTDATPASAAPAISAATQPFGAAARINLQDSARLDARARAWLDGFAARYNARTAGSKAYSEQHRAQMADPRVVTGFNPAWKELVYPIVVTRSDGAQLWDVDGNRYIDLLNAFGANFLGYQPAAIKQALRAQIETGFEIGPQHPLAGEVAQLLGAMTGMPRIAFCNTGSEAVMGAMRVARTVTGRKTIVIFRDSYHGIFDEVIVRGTPQLRSIAAAPGILASAVENILVLDYGSDAALATIRERAAELAAVMIEPVQARNPELQPRAFVQALREICDTHGCALIFDEVITGFRIAPGGAQEFFGVRADLATYGKIIGGGLPLAAIGGVAKWMDALDGGGWQFGDASRPEAGVTYFAGTFVRHPLALAAAKATLLQLQQGGAQLQADLNARTAALVERLNEGFRAQAAPLSAVAFSSLWRLRIDAEQPCADLFYYALRARGLHLYAQFNCFLTLAHGAAEIDEIVAAIESATAELLDAGVLTRRAALTSANAGTQTPVAQDQRPVLLPEEIAPTDAQLEKWIACQFGEAANVAFNESQLLMLHGELDAAALQRALAAVCARHEAFAMSFAPDGGALRVGPAPPLLPTLLDFSGARAEENLHAHCSGAIRRPFDLAQAPLARIDLIRLGELRHALFIVAHHLVFDGWSAAVFLEEVARGYGALRSGQDPSWPEAQSFRAYALEEHRRRAGSQAQEQVAFWKAQYARLPEALDLPLDRPRTKQADFAANTVFHDFPAHFSQALKQFARTHGVTLYSTLLAGFGVLLARLSGQRDFSIGIPFAGQASAGRDHMLGDGVNTLPLRLALAHDESFQTLARRCHAALLDAAENQDLTLHTLLGALGARQRAECSALTDVIFNLNPRVPALDFGALTYRLRDCAKAALVRDLFFNFNESDDMLTLDVHYRSALFDADTIRRWIGHLQTLLGAAMAQPALECGVLPVLDAAQEHQLAHGCDATGRTIDPERTLLDLFREQAARTPERIAIECEGSTLSYGELLRQSSALAQALRQRGVQQGMQVGISVPRSVEMLVALLGVMASGAAYVPLDANHPAPRLCAIADDADVRHLLVLDAAHVPAALADGRRVHALDALLAAAPEAIALPHVPGSAPVYVLYTSGSSGAPKGVRVLHSNLLNCLLSMRERPGIDAQDVLCAVTTLSFDIAGLELYLPLLVGARVLLATDAQHRDPEALLALLRERGASVLQTTPSWLRVLIGGGRARQLPRMKLLVGGEELPRDLANAVLPCCAELWNLYGPTETTIWSTLARVVPGEGSVPIGTPIANTRVYLLDAQQQLVPPGARGELWIAGAGVAEGYLNQPAQTADRFRADPFAGGGERMYRSGDVASWRAGELHFHGRLDAQFKLRGFRIEPGEIEAAALTEGDVQAAVASVYALSADDRRLVLYVVASGVDTAAARAEFVQNLRLRLRQKLPPQLLPQHLELLDALPCSEHGKIDRRALPAPQALTETDAGAARRDEPVDGLTRALLEIWRELLGVADVGVDANFFDLGGDSLLGVELFQRALAMTGVNLPLATLLTAPTVREQARLFRDAGARDPHASSAQQAQRASDAWSPLVAIQESGRQPPLFCIHAVGGNVLNYIPLARAVGTDQPVFGLQAVGLDGITPPLETIEDMAARYLREIRTRFPRGPYYLCGGSMGGLIAFELAQMLVAANEKVAFLGLFDTFGPDSFDPMSGRALARTYQRWRDRLARARRLDAPSRRTLFSSAIAHRIGRGRDALQTAWHRWRGTALPHDIRYREIERVHLRADCAYKPRPYFGPLTLFRATEKCELTPGSRTLGWESVALGGIHVIDLPGSHDNLIEQPELAHELRQALEMARAAEQGGQGASPDAAQRRKVG